MNKRFKYILQAVIIFFALSSLACLASAQPAGKSESPLLEKATDINRGIWVSVFSENKFLSSKDKVKELIAICKKSRINQIYLQLYQSGRAYYDSKIADNSRYQEILKDSGEDTIDYLLKLAGENRIQVFAWVNLLSIGKNNSATILAKYTDEVLVRDQYLRTPLRDDKNSEVDKYYLREDQLFLDPGDSRVRKYLSAIVEEVISRYPKLSGVHLDYIRYPYAVPFTPGARFYQFGLSYGHNKKSAESCLKETGINISRDLGEQKNAFIWDGWRRSQIIKLLEDIRMVANKNNPHLLISCAVVPDVERAYLSVFQDWPLWLETGIVDYVVLMDYSNDTHLVSELAKAAIAFKGKGKVYIGLGLFLAKDAMSTFSPQFNEVSALNPDGIVIFSIDNITSSVAEFLSSR